MRQTNTFHKIRDQEAQNVRDHEAQTKEAKRQSNPIGLTWCVAKRRVRIVLMKSHGNPIVNCVYTLIKIMRLSLNCLWSNF